VKSTRSALNRSRRVGLLVWCLAFACGFSTTAFALPTGRYWTPTDTTRVPGHTRLFVTGAVLDSSGSPVLYAAAEGGIGYDYVALSWRDSAWVSRWNLGYGLPYMYPADGTDGRLPLIWQTYRNSWTNTPPYLVMSEDLGTTYAPPDTVFATPEVDYSNWFYAGASAGAWRWAVKADFTYGMRLFASSKRGVWNEHNLTSEWDVSPPDVKVVGESTAVVAWGQSGVHHLRWGLIKGDVWEESADGPPTGLTQGGAALRRGEDGRFWVSFGDGHAYVRLALLDPATRSWQAKDTLRCAYRTPGNWITAGGQFSPDTSSHSTFGWYAYNYSDGSRAVCVCTQSDSGAFGLAEVVPETEAAAQFRVVRDRSGDTWVAWWTMDLQGMFWTHSAVRATATDLQVLKAGPRPLLVWRLSEPAPGSWWTVLRSTEGQAFEPVARVQAGASVAMSWSDDKLPGHVRKTLTYRLRRDCLDQRYEWLSEVAGWYAGRHGPRVLLLPRPLGTPRVDFVVEQASGPVEVSVYDVQGRRVMRTSFSSTLGRVSARLDLDARMSSGVYFLRVMDAARQEATAKLVVLR
jgi:hypothetical protein